jgi:hypothetical protein
MWRNDHVELAANSTVAHFLPWDIELTIDESVDETEEEPEVSECIIFTHTYFVC